MRTVGVFPLNYNLSKAFHSANSVSQNHRAVSQLATANVRFSSKESDVSPALEWIEASGDGSYASSTVGGAQTRRYHGLLVASAQPPVSRRLALSRLDETLVGPDGTAYPLSGSLFKNQDLSKIKTPSPLLESFSAYPVATWIYTLNDPNTKLQKQLALRKDQATVVVGYTLSPQANGPVELRIKPFVNDRDFHGVTEKQGAWTQQTMSKGVTLKSQDGNPVYLQWNSSLPNGQKIQYQPEEHWYKNFYYPREADRGLERQEHHFTPGEVTITLRPGETVNLTSSSQVLPVGGLDINDIATEKARHYIKLMRDSGLPDTAVNRLLIRASDQFIVQRRGVNGVGNSTTILAGYHWFNDWGRDAMIALPGLTLATRRFKDAEGILNTFAKHAKNGMLPNHFPDSAEASPSYNTLDASMWWFNTVNAYRTAIQSTSPDMSVKKASYFFLKSQYEALQKVVTHHIYGRHSGQALINANSALSIVLDGTKAKLPVGDDNHGIGMEPDGLISADNPQLTWMDAAKDNQVFTPRSGKAVEINALWYNGLKSMVDIAKDLQSFQRQHNPENLPSDRIRQQDYQYTMDIGRYDGLARIVKESMQKFWNADNQCLYDLADTSNLRGKNQIRPNQIMALSLPHRAFYRDQEQAILKTVENHLLTPYGLRSLSPKDVDYASHYPNAGPLERDKVYHQGTVWSWLIGPYLDAYLNVHGNNETNRKEAHKRLQPLLEHMQGKIAPHVDSGSAIGGIAEIFDGDAPHYAKGAVNQAWSVAEVLRQQVALSK